MSTHKLFAASKMARVMKCPGSMAFVENQVDDGESSTYADDGSASHELGAMTLTRKNDCIDWLGTVIKINNREYTFDEERCARIQGYVDDVRRRAIGGHLFIERSSELAEDVGGTADAAIVLPAQRLGIIEDLKDGSGEKVYASYVVKPATDTTPEIREPNEQLATYARGLLPDFEMFGPIDNILLVVYQPKLNHIDEFSLSVAHLKLWGEKQDLALFQAREVMQDLVHEDDFNPGKRQCRWCRGAHKCDALTKFVQDEVAADFETIAAQPPMAPSDPLKLAAAYEAVPLIEQWCAAVKSQLQRLVSDGQEVIGPDGKPYKYVEGKEGSRKWIDEKQAEAALLGQLPSEKVYTAPKVITAPAASKLLCKKATQALWTDIFEPLISRPRGQPILVMGSDERPAFTGVAKADDFEDELSQ